MPCYSPLEGYRSALTTKNGKRKLSFSKSSGYVDLPVSVACGQCIGCRLERSRQWAVRLMHEASMHELSVFVTLTYETPPPGGSLRKSDFTLFMKRLRQYDRRCFEARYKDSEHKPAYKPIRFFQCGEYGETTLRPHHHALIFGLDFGDKKKHSTSNGNTLYTSQKLDELWSFGHCLIGEVNFQTAGYVARYCMKKVTGERAEAHYRSVNLDTGEVVDRVPEYVTMSRRPGIGAKWYERYAQDVFPSDHVVVNGKESYPPRFYKKIFAGENPDAERALTYSRIRKASARKADNTPERLSVRRVVKESQIQSLKRKL